MIISTIKSSYIILLPHFKMNTVKVEPRKYTKESMSTQVTIPAAKGGVETTYPFQWLVHKPQSHAVMPFETNQASRDGNKDRK